MTYTEFFAVLSALVVLASYPAYIIRIWQRKIIPNLASWSIFVVISLAFLLAFKSSGAKENGWVTWGPLIGCSVILVVTLFRSPEKIMTRTDIICLILGVVSIVVGYSQRTTQIWSRLPYILLSWQISLELLRRQSFSENTLKKIGPECG